MTKQEAREILKTYVEQKIDPGHFLTAMLENNLCETLSRADSESLVNLLPIFQVIYNEIPSACWGSKEKVEAFLS